MLSSFAGILNQLNFLNFSPVNFTNLKAWSVGLNVCNFALFWSWPLKPLNFLALFWSLWNKDILQINLDQIPCRIRKLNLGDRGLKDLSTIGLATFWVIIDISSSNFISNLRYSLVAYLRLNYLFKWIVFVQLSYRSRDPT